MNAIVGYMRVCEWYMLKRVLPADSRMAKRPASEAMQSRARR